ncbi:Fatty acid hydroxylase superfamily protein [Enhygromyxa salina]|uniref:Fatty acid hydroxylase superfamily protein n=1 Tax=Enhygromyxa salina TaxID=215803 RepID=A0A2S9YG46_9BACT|nr:sterol desaturase family protein [Enhygromyxa salina]PRQ04068.1 Fatty acid hydroxylase superfamily protein [Enhygromyxa salina]
MALHSILIAVLSASALVQALLYILYISRASDGYKIYPLKAKNYGRIVRLVVPNTLLSGALVVGLSYLASPWLFHAEETTALELVADVVVTLGAYDLLYYCLHRFLFHEWQLLRSVHVLHHTVKYPTAIESLYVHPVENSLGVILLMVCLALVGPVSLPAFAVILLVYSWLNIVIHSGLDFRSRWLRPVAYMVRKHARHHRSMRGGNYASITPLPDILFGTAE